jgi:glycosyltransferase involved in cell wall biosynthesis
MGRVLRTVAAKMADGVIVYGSDGRRQLVQAGIGERKVFVARNTMWVRGHHNSAGQDKEYFLFVGRIQERKRLDLLVDAYAVYADRFGDKALGLKIVGDGEDSRLRQKCDWLKDIKGRNCEWVEGTTDDSLLADIFSKALAYVSPGHVGLGVLHAFSSGHPVLRRLLPPRLSLRRPGANHR